MRRGLGVAAIGLGLIFVGTVPRGLAADSGSASAPAPDASATVSGACGTAPKNPGPCEYWVCVSGTWELYPRPVGTTCNDSNACTYADQCDSIGECHGTIGCVPSGSCEVCNGTSSCGKLAAGSACPSSPDGNPCEAICDGVSPLCQPQ